MANPPPKIRWAIFIALALLALAVRLPQLGERPMHTDESINAYITGRLLAGEKYHYDPQDRHGPVLYLFAKPVVELCGAKTFSGLTEAELRLTPVIIGSATVLMFGAGVEMFGFIPCLIAALLFAVAPLPVYYSRYFIHETLFVAATWGLILSGGRALKSRSILVAALAGFCAALMLAGKETAIIHFFALAVAAVICLWLAKQPEKIPPAKMLLTASISFLAASILLFTWFGQNWSALADLFRAIPHFAERAGGQGHEKPFGYYLSILDPQFLFFIVAATGIYAVICDAVAGTRRAGLLLAIYGVLIFLIYSAIPYKTPWLALNFWLPCALLAGFAVEWIWSAASKASARGAILILGICLAVLVARDTRQWVFKNPAGEKNPYAYAHTTEDVLNLPPCIDAVSSIVAGGIFSGCLASQRQITAATARAKK